MPNSTSASDNPSKGTPPRPDAARPRRRIWRRLGIVLAGLCTLLLLVWGLLLTPFGLRLAARVAERGIAAGSGMQARIENVSGILPFSLDVGRFALADAKGAWLVVADARVSWSPFALLRGRVVVNEVAAGVVRVRRAPDLPPAPQQPAAVEWPPRFPHLPPILVDRLAVGQLILDKELAGQDAVIRIEGRLAESGSGAVGLAASATRLDGDKPLSVNLAGSLNYAAWRLAAKASLEDAPGGLLAAALAGPDAGALAVSLTGDGPLDAWKGRLTTKLAGKDILSADMGLAVPLKKNALAAFSLDAKAFPPQGLLPEAAARLVGDHPTIRLAGRAGIVSDDLFLDDVAATVAAGTLAAKAGIDATDAKMTGAADVTLPDAALLDPSLSGRAVLHVSASGPLAKPQLAARLRLDGFKAGPVSLAAADLDATGDPAGELSGAFPGAALTLKGALKGLVGPQGTTLLGDALTLTAAAQVDADGNIAAREATLAGQGGSLRAADVRVAGGNINGKLSIDMADVAGAAGLAGMRLTGALAAAADIAADDTGKGNATLTLRLTRLAAPDGADQAAAAVAALLGPAPTLAAKADFSAAGAHLSSLELAGKALSLSGSGGYEAASDALTAKASLTAADLTVLEKALGEKTAGKLRLEVTAAGTAAAPRLTLKADADRLALGDLALSGATLDATANDLATSPNGTLSLAARREGESARIAAGFALRGGTLSVKDLRLTAPEAAFSGEAVIDTATGRVSGKLSGKAANLAPLGRFAGQSLGGSLQLAITAAANRGNQDATCELSATGLRLPGLAAASLSVSANLADVTGANPRGKANVAGKDLAAGGLDLAAVTLAANGDGRALSATLDAKGTIPGGKPLVIATTASMTTAGKGRRITLQSLSGSLDAKKFNLTAPTTLTMAEGTTRLDALSLAFDKAKIEASASLSPRAVTGKAAVNGFPLPLLASFGVTGVGGTAQLAATLSGSPARPELSAEVKIGDLVLAAEKQKDLPHLSVTAKATLAGGKASLRAAVSPAGKKEAVTVEANLPARFAISPFAFDVPPNGALSGRVTADSDLSQMAALLAQANTRIVGRLSADMALGGTVAAPTVTGSLALAAQKLENADIGLVLTNLTLKANAAGGTITIEQAAGQDRHGGSFTLSGHVGIADPVGGPVDLALKLHRLRVAGLDLAKVTADGDLKIAGTLSRMQATGKIEIGPAEINLPTSLPPDVVVIPVTYVNDPNAPKKKTKAPPPAAARHIGLDITAALGQAVYVRGLGLESRWAGQVHVTGTAAAPTIVGKYYVVKGLVELFGSNLEIHKGEVVFSGASPPAPTLDILAENTSGDVTAGVSISGDATSPSISLVSSPPLPHDEILSRILFGQSARTLSPIQAAQLAQAAASLYAGGTPTSILARTRRILGLDQLSLVSSGKGSGMSSTVLKAGKEIVKGVTVGVEQGMGAQSGAVSVEVQVTPNITVDSRVGADNKQGVGVNWKWDY